MSMADKIMENARPHLADGEQVQGAFAGQKSIRHGLLDGSYRAVVATDRRFLIFRSGMVPQTVLKRLIEEAPRDQVLGEPGGLFYDLTIGSETMKVNRRYYGQIRAIDAAIS